MRLTKERVVCLFYLILAVAQNATSLFKMTNFQCESFNKSWAVFQECRLRAIKRDRATMNMTVDFLYPAHTIDLQIEILKRANGYKPFLVNTTIDFCGFMKKRNDPVMGIVYDLFKDFSNINHTCPYMGQQIISGFYPKHEILQLPLPNGDYAIWMTWYLNSKKTFATNVYWTFTEKS